MEYNKQVEAVIEEIAVFAIKSKALAPNSIFYNIEKTRLMDAALGLQLVARTIEGRVGRKSSISKLETEDFKRELDCIRVNINDLNNQLEVQGKYSQNNTKNGTKVPEAAPLQSLKTSQGKVLVSDGVQQRSIPATPTYQGNLQQGNASLSDSPCICPLCPNILFPSPASSVISSVCSCENCLWHTPSSTISQSEWSASDTDSGFESTGRRFFGP